MSESKQCGCRVEMTPVGSLAVRCSIVYCPLHAAAPIGRELAEALLNIETEDKYPPDHWTMLLDLARRFAEAAGTKERP